MYAIAATSQHSTTVAKLGADKSGIRGKGWFSWNFFLWFDMIGQRGIFFVQENFDEIR
jgi:hypothetical protein